LFHAGRLLLFFLMISCVVVLPLAETIPGKLAWEGREELGRESSVGHLAFVLAHMQVVEDGEPEMELLI